MTKKKIKSKKTNLSCKFFVQFRKIQQEISKKWKKILKLLGEVIFESKHTSSVFVIFGKYNQEFVF